MRRVLRPTAPAVLDATRPSAGRPRGRTSARVRWCLSAPGLALVILGALPQPARAWELFRSENSEARKANELLRQGKSEEAEKLYAEAARALPNHPGVHFNRGLALLQGKKYAEAREAFRLATQGQADAQLRGNAHYNMGLAFMREADAAAQAQDHDLAQKYLREAVDAFKHSLRNVPGNRDAAWNLETAKRRLVELERQKEERDKQEQEKADQDKSQDADKSQDSNDSQGGDSEQKSDGQQGQDDASQPSERKQDSAGEENTPQGSNDKDKPQDAQPEQDKTSGQGEQNKPEPKTPQPEDKQQGQGQEQDRREQQPSGAPQEARGEPALPEHMQKALDALAESDENLQKHRARMRSQQRPRRIEKDW
jgi:tetratricopeptide (TPR) repeat protein